MATRFQRPENSQPPDTGTGDQRQSIPKILLVCLVVGLIVIIAAVGVSLKHNHVGATSGTAGQSADRAVGPHLGSEGTANGTSVPPDAPAQPTGSGQGGGPGAMGSNTGSSNAAGTGSSSGGGGTGGG